MTAKSMEDIAELLKTVKFKKKIFGGVDEQDVWRIIAKLQTEYRNVVDEQQLRAEMLVADRDKTIARMKQEIAVK